MTATDCNKQALELAESMFREKADGRLVLEHVPVGELDTLSKECDILSPNALGNVLREDTIPSIKASIVCGAANNQLGSPTDSKLLQEMGVTYIVDFLCNRMGIVNCANETYGRLANDPAIQRHFSRHWPDSVWNATKNVLKVVEEEKLTPFEAAVKIANANSLVDHPIWPGRSKHIRDELVSSGWDKNY